MGAQAAVRIAKSAGAHAPLRPAFLASGEFHASHGLPRRVVKVAAPFEGPPRARSRLLRE